MMRPQQYGDPLVLGGDPEDRNTCVLEGADILNHYFDQTLKPTYRVISAQVEWLESLGEDVLFCFIQQVSKYLHPWPQFIGAPAPFGHHRFGVLLGEGRADKGADHAFAAPGGVGQRVSHELDAAMLPRSIHDFDDRHLDAQIGVGEDELDATQPAKDQLS